MYWSQSFQLFYAQRNLKRKGPWWWRLDSHGTLDQKEMWSDGVLMWYLMSLCRCWKTVHYDFIQWYRQKQLYISLYIYICMLASKESSQVHTPVPPPTVHRKYISHRQNTETHIPKFQHPNVQNINCRIMFSQKHHRHYFTSSSMFCLCFFVKHVLTILFEWKLS